MEFGNCRGRASTAAPETKAGCSHGLGRGVVLLAWVWILASAGWLTTGQGATQEVPSFETCTPLLARPKPGKVDLTWNRLEGVAGYQVFRRSEADASVFQQIAVASPNAVNYQDTPPNEETTFLYFVRAVRGDTDFCDSEVAAARPTRQRGTPNFAPVFFSSPPLEASDGDAFLYQARAVDPYPAGTLTFSKVSGPEELEVDGKTGLIRWKAIEGQHPVVIRALDGKGLADLQSFTIDVAAPPPPPPPREPEPVVVLARTVDEVGHPVPGVLVEETGPGPGSTRTLGSNPDDGLVGLGQVQGRHLWRFEKQGYLPVWREQTVTNTHLSVLPSPRLVPIHGPPVAVSPVSGGRLSGVSAGLEIQVGPGGVDRPSNALLTPLSGQTLPGLLPLGWSPLQAFHLGSDGGPAFRAAVTATLWGPMTPGESAVVVRWGESPLGWRVASIEAAPVSSGLSFALEQTGTYAVVVADSGFYTPPSPVVGEALAGSTVPFEAYASLEAVGEARPASSPASTDPDSVTAVGDLTVTRSDGPIPSGLALWCEFSDTYELRSGKRRRGVPYDNWVICYQRPGDADPATAGVRFRVRPSLLLGMETLTRAVIRADVSTPTPFPGGILETNESHVVQAPITVRVAAGALSRRQAVQLRLRAPSDYAGILEAEPVVVAAFDLGVPDLPLGIALSLEVAGLPANHWFALGRVLDGNGRAGLEPVERFQTDASGRLMGQEPSTGRQLPGLGRSGRYVLIQVGGPLRIVSGVIRDGAGVTQSGLSVRMKGQPWLTQTDTAGAYRLLAPVGAHRVLVEDRLGASLAEGMAEVTGEDRAGMDLNVVPSGPRIVSTSPVRDATRVSTVSPIEVAFNRPMQRLPGPTAALTLTAEGVPVVAEVIWNIAGDVARLLPRDPLEHQTLYRIEVDAGLSDFLGQPLSGERQFQFTTEPRAFVRSSAARITRIEGNDGKAVMEGSQGMAEPGETVVLVNDFSGETLTVLAKPDGSFSGSIRAGSDDPLLAVIFNSNGSSNAVSVAKQLYPDGSVALAEAGGTIEVTTPNGPAEFVIEPGALSGKAKFKFESVPRTELLALAGNAEPPGGRLLGGFRSYAIEGEALARPIDVVFPIPVDQLGLPPGVNVADCSFGLALIRDVDGVPAYELVDSMSYENGKLATHSPPFPGYYATYVDEWIAILTLNYRTRGTTVSGKVITRTEGTTEANPIVGAVVRGKLGNEQTSPGYVYSVSRAPDGAYAFQASAPILSAVHPWYRHKEATQDIPAGSGPQEVNLVFTLPANTTTNGPAFTEFLASPAFALPGTEIPIQISAVDDDSVPKLRWKIQTLRSLRRGVRVSATDVRIEASSPGTSPGPNGTNVNLSVLCTKEALVALLVTAMDDFYHSTSKVMTLQFGGEVPTSDEVPPVSDLMDRTGPRVLSTSPAPGAKNVRFDTPLVVRFDETVNPDLLKDPALVVTEPPLGLISRELDPDRKELTLRFAGTKPATRYSLTLKASAIRDVNTAVGPDPQGRYGNVFDQDPTTLGYDDFTMDFVTQELPVRVVTNAPVGTAAVAVTERYLLALSEGSYLSTYSLSDRGNPERINANWSAGPAGMKLFGEGARDMLVIPNYGYMHLPAACPNDLDPNRPCWNPRPSDFSARRTEDLVVVLGGTFFSKPWLNVLRFAGFPNDAPAPLAFQRTGTGALGGNPIRVRWSAPCLAFWEATQVPVIRIVNLQAFLIGNAIRDRSDLESHYGAVLPDSYKDGVDLNDDGDYADAGEEAPLPANNPNRLPGEILTLPVGEELHELGEGRYELREFEIAAGGEFVGVLLREHNAPSAWTVYSTLLSGGGPVSLGGENRVQLKGHSRNLLALFPQELRMGGETSFRNIVIATVETDSPESPNTVAVIDLSDPSSPKLVGEVPIPKTDADTRLLGLTRLADGRVLASGTNTSYLLDPSLFLAPLPNPVAGHVSVIAELPGIGGDRRSFGVSKDGVVAHTGVDAQPRYAPIGPEIRIVAFENDVPFHPREWMESERPDDARIQARLDRRTVATSLRLARYRGESGICRSTLGQTEADPPDAKVHYYALVRIPGEAGPTIELAVESLNWAGNPLRNRGYLFPPVHAVGPGILAETGQTPSATDAPVRTCTAWRLSGDPASPYYDVYLSRPFTVVGESISRDELRQLDDRLERDILWSGASIRVSIDPSQVNKPELVSLAGAIENGRHFPAFSASATSFPADYIQSSNPMPLLGGQMIGLTAGTVAAHSSELIVRSADIALPGRRLPIVFVRTYSGQALYDGPFGRGWDHGYNLRVVALDTNVLAEDFKLPMVVRANPSDSEIAAPQDVLVYDGAGRVLVYKYLGTSVPPGLANDPLAARLRWVPSVERPGTPPNIAAYYQPPPGSFSPLFRFTDGRFALLAPDGTQTWFGQGGQLLKIYDRFEANTMEFTYDSRGELVRITNDLGPFTEGSTSLPNAHLDLGYFRAAGDPEFRKDIDIESADRTVLGRIARLKDHTGRDVLYDYLEDGDPATLDRTESPNVITLSSPEGVSGRQKTRYSYSPTSDARATRTLRAVLRPNREADAGGVSSLEVGEFKEGASNLVAALSVAGRVIRIDQKHGATAKELSAAAGQTIVDGPTTDAPATRITYTFDPFGRSTNVVVRGKVKGTDTEKSTATSFNAVGLPLEIRYPEQNQTRYAYDDGTPDIPLRSRANLLETQEIPDSRRQGTPRTAVARYNRLYNLPSGEQLDFKAQKTVVQLDDTSRYVAAVIEGGETNRVVLDNRGQTVSETDPQRIETRRVYRPDGLLANISSGEGTDQVEIRYEYSSLSGRRGLPFRVLSLSGVVEEYLYDELDRTIRVERSEATATGGDDAQPRLKSVTDLVFDGAGNLIRQAALVETNVVQVSRFEYDDFGLPTKQHLDGVDVEGTTKTLTTEIQHDDYFRVRRVLPPSGEAVVTTFDGLGRAESRQVVAGGVVGFQARFEHDLNDNVTVSRIGTAEARTEYDGHDRPVREFSPTGARVERTFDANDNVSGTKVYDTTDSDETLPPNADGATGGRLVGEYSGAYDERDRPIRTTMAADAGVSTSLMAYRTAERSLDITGALGEKTVLSSDSVGRVASVVNPRAALSVNYDVPGRTVRRELTDDMGPSRQVTTFDPFGNLERLEDARGRVHRFSSGFDGRLLSATTPENKTYRNAYTAWGEPTESSRPDGQTLKATYDSRRDVTAVAPVPVPGKGFSYNYDELGRLTGAQHADGVGATFGEFNELQQPLRVTLPRGLTQTNHYDAAGRLIERRILGLSPQGRLDTWGYDALSRVRGATSPVPDSVYPEATVSYRYGIQGQPTNVVFGQFGKRWELQQRFDLEGNRVEVTYPSDLRIDFGRDQAGRLLSIQPAGLDPVVRSTTYASASAPAVRIFGNDAIESYFIYDPDRRVQVRRYRRLRDGQVLAEVRYAYDGSGMQVARQFLHRGGRTDLFGYDGAHKVVRADLSARPKIPGELPREFPGFQVHPDVPGPESWAPGFFAREFHFDSAEVMTNATILNPAGIDIPAFASEFRNVDPTLFVGEVDGVARARDASGNVTRTPLVVRVPGSAVPHAVMANLIYNEIDQLTRVERDDGVVVEHTYGPTGLRIRRTVTGDPTLCVPGDHEFLYDGINLIEIRDVSAGDHRLLARFYYGDDGDELIAGDLRDSSSGELRRLYYLTDALRSVMALADADGNIVERYGYDVWGEVTIQPPDTRPPEVSRVLRSENELVIEFTEPVLPALDGDDGTNVVHTLSWLSGTIIVRSDGNQLPGEIVPEEVGYQRSMGLRLRFIATDTLPGALELVLNPGVVVDLAGNKYVSLTVPLAESPESYRGPPSSEASTLSRAATFSTFGFHGQLHDEDTGLVYMRARYYEPRIGQFLARDPEGYVDSGNGYLGFAGNGVNFRDPTGAQCTPGASPEFSHSSVPMYAMLYPDFAHRLLQEVRDPRTSGERKLQLYVKYAMQVIVLTGEVVFKMITDMPHDIDESSIHAGERSAQAMICTQSGEYSEAFLQSLYAVRESSSAFTTAAFVAQPLASTANRTLIAQSIGRTIRNVDAEMYLVQQQYREALLVVGPEEFAEFAWINRQVSDGVKKAVAANPRRTRAASVFEDAGGVFFEGGVESVPGEFGWVHENFPQPLGVFVTARPSYMARLHKVAPGGRLTMITESQELIEMYRAIATAEGNQFGFSSVRYTRQLPLARKLPPAVSQYVPTGEPRWLIYIWRSWKGNGVKP